MKRIVIINGSQKKTASATDKLASEMQVLLPTEYVCHTVNALQLSVSRGAAHTEGYQQTVPIRGERFPALHALR